MCDKRKQKIIISTYFWIHAFRERPNLKILLQLNSNVLVKIKIIAFFS